MSTNITFNGVTYAIPAEGDSGWGTVLSNYFIALSTGTLQKSGGSFALLADIDFGAVYGLKSAYYKSSATNPSGTGILRLGNNESIGWRNAANTSDFSFKVNASDVLQFNGTNVLLSGSIVNSDINASAAIALSKLEALATGKALQSNASTGVIEVSSVTNAELSYLSGVTSGIQTQINAKEATLTAGTTSQYYRGDKSWQTLDKSAVGLSNVDNTTDANKPISTATQSALDLKANSTQVATDIASAVTNHNAATTGVHGVTGNVVGTSDAQVITNKDIDGGAASNTRRFTLPKDTKTNLDALTRKQATLVYASDENKVYADDGSSLKEIGGAISVSSSLSLGASGTLSLNSTITIQTILVSGSTGPVVLSTTPFTTTAPANGTVIKIIGNSDSNTVTIPSNDAAKGVLGYGVTLGRGQTVTYEYNSTLDRYVILGVSN